MCRLEPSAGGHPRLPLVHLAMSAEASDPFDPARAPLVRSAFAGEAAVILAVHNRTTLLILPSGARILSHGPGLHGAGTGGQQED